MSLWSPERLLANGQRLKGEKDRLVVGQQICPAWTGAAQGWRKSRRLICRYNSQQ
jgi:hypothetical protein